MGFLRSRFFHVVLILGLAFCIFRFGIRPPAPASVIRLYMTVVLLATLGAWLAVPHAVQRSLLPDDAAKPRVEAESDETRQ